MKNEYTPQGYVIGFQEAQRHEILTALAPYEPVQLRLIPFCAVTVHDALQQQSLLETLLSLPNVTYRKVIDDYRTQKE